MKIAVTGASGFLGNVLCRELIKAGHQVKAQYFSRTEALVGLELEMFQADVLDLQAMKELVDGTEGVFHCAAVISIDGDPDGRVQRTNEIGTQNVIQACLSASSSPRLIYYSSIHALSTVTHTGIIDENASLAGPEATAYDYSKANGQRMIHAAQKQGLDTVVLNPTGVYGPWDFQPSLFGQMLLDLYHGKVPALVKGGYNFVDVRDVTFTSIKAMTEAKSGESYILAGHTLKIREIAQLFEEITWKKAPRFTLPIWVAKVGLPFVKSWSKFRGSIPPYTHESLAVLSSKETISDAKARTELDHQCRSPKETLSAFYDWAKARGLLDPK